MSRAGLALASVLAVAAPAAAEDWVLLGGRARGMGGAGVAGEASPFWNPAALGHPRSGGKKGRGEESATDADKGKQLGIRAGLWAAFEIAAVGDVVRELDDIADFYFDNDMGAIQTRFNSGQATVQDLRNVIGLIKQIQDLDKPGEGVYGVAAGEAFASIQTPLATFGLFYRGVGYAGVDPVVGWSFDFASAFADDGFTEVFNTTGTGNTPATPDGISLSTTLVGVGLTAAQADELAFQAEQSGVPLNDPNFRNALLAVATATVAAGAGGGTDLDTLFWNQSGFDLKGIIVREGGVSLARHHKLLGMGWSFGCNLKYMEATTNQNRIAVSRIMDGEMTLDKLLDDWNRNREVSTSFGVDAGILVEVIPGVRLGVSGRNLNRPVFAWEGPRSYFIPRQFRAGVNLTPLPGITFAVEGDLHETTTRVIEDYKTQMVGGGIELAPGGADSALGMALRLGAYQNVAMPDEEIVYTASLGFRFGPIRVDVGGAATKASFDVENADGAFDTSSSDSLYDFEETYPERFGLSATITFIFPF